MYCVCIKATSKTDIYENNAEKIKGAVCYETGQACFDVKTAIQPDNLLPISHQDIVTQNRRGTFAVIGSMPDDFPPRLAAAIKASATMSPRWKGNMLAKIGEA